MDPGGCTTKNAPNGTPCGGGDACTNDGTCQNGTCAPGSPKSCDDGNPCTTDPACTPGMGCQHTPVADGTPCGLSVCALGGVTGNICAAGVCTSVLTPCSPYQCANGSQCQTCSDGVKNGNETDTDCGGGAPCPKCGSGKACQQDSDCGPNLTCNMGSHKCQ
jgi:hypothetical protein